jgi:hypothetical protein
MTTPSVTIVDSKYGDWKGLYINGILAYEAKYITANDVLDALHIEYELKSVNNDYRFNMPKSESECK